MKILTFIFAMILCVGNVDLQAQITFDESQSITRLMDQWVTINKSEPDLRGWRIQIITTADRREMDAALSKFNSLYPNIGIDWEHVVPYYKIKVGAYEEKMELMGFLLELKEEFPTVIPIMDDIPKDQFIRI